MGPFEFVAVIVITPIILVAAIVLAAICRKPARTQQQDRQLNDQFSKLNARFDKLEKRMSNIETIVIDRDKPDPFDELKNN